MTLEQEPTQTPMGAHRMSAPLAWLSMLYRRAFPRTWSPVSANPKARPQVWPTSNGSLRCHRT